MLVLNRKVGEEILIGPDIVIKIVEMNNRCVRIGINAPKEIAIKRREIEHGYREEGKNNADDSQR